MIKRPLTCLIQLIFGVLLVSCGSRENQSEEKYPGLTLQVDTVRIDPKDELLVSQALVKIKGICIILIQNSTNSKKLISII